MLQLSSCYLSLVSFAFSQSIFFSCSSTKRATKVLFVCCNNFGVYCKVATESADAAAAADAVQRSAVEHSMMPVKALTVSNFWLLFDRIRMEFVISGWSFFLFPFVSPRLARYLHYEFWQLVGGEQKLIRWRYLREFLEQRTRFIKLIVASFL